jgi:hypothetical protein
MRKVFFIAFALTPFLLQARGTNPGRGLAAGDTAAPVLRARIVCAAVARELEKLISDELRNIDQNKESVEISGPGVGGAGERPSKEQLCVSMTTRRL